MKYADSFHHVETLDTTGTTTYSDWFDVSWANELYAYVDSTETGSATSESVAVTVERYLPYRTSNPTTVLTFTAITGDTTEEKYAYTPETDASAPDVHNKLGMRVRFKYVTSGTWTVTSVVIYSTIYAKRN